MNTKSRVYVPPLRVNTEPFQRRTTSYKAVISSSGEYWTLKYVKSMWTCDVDTECSWWQREQKITLISVFRRGINEIFALLGCYAAQIGSYLPTFRDNPSVPPMSSSNHLTDLIVFGEDYKSRCSSLRIYLHSSVTFPVLRPNIFLSTLF
jgi:hypothetical protein